MIPWTYVTLTPEADEPPPANPSATLPYSQADLLLHHFVVALGSLGNAAVIEHLAWVLDRAMFPIWRTYRLVVGLRAPSAETMAELAASGDIVAWEAYLEAHQRFLTADLPEGTAPELLLIQRAFSTFVLLLMDDVVAEAEGAVDVPPLDWERVETLLLAAVETIQACPEDHPDAERRRLEATFEVLDAALAVYAANDNDPHAAISLP